MLDDLRTRFPELGFALYALDPKGVVTLEVVTPDGGLFTFTGASAKEAVEAAFPPPVVLPAPKAAAPPPPKPEEGDVFA